MNYKKFEKNYNNFYELLYKNELMPSPELLENLYSKYSKNVKNKNSDIFKLLKYHNDVNFDFITSDREMLAFMLAYELHAY